MGDFKPKDVFDLLTVSENLKIIENCLEAAINLLKEVFIPEEIVVLLNILHKKKELINS